MKKPGQEETEYGFAELCGNGIRSLFAMEFLLHGLLLLMGSEFPEWQLGKAYFLQMQVVLIPVLVCFELLTGAKKRICRFGKIAAGILLPAGCGIYVLFHRHQLLEGLYQVYNEYINYWNAYYKTNYSFYDTEGGEREFFLAVSVCIIFILCITLRYLTGIRLFDLLPGSLVLTLGLLVNCLPLWRGLAEGFVGVLFLFSVPWEKGKIVFHDSSGRKKNGVRTIGIQFVITAFVLLFAILIVTCIPRLLGKEAEKIPENAHKFIKFQQQAEEKLASLSFPMFSQDEAVLDNRTPKYSGKEILEIHASDSPVTNLYLKDFYSSTYVGGKWEKTEDFEKEAKGAGYTPEHLGSLLHQQYFEAKRTRRNDRNGDTPWVLDYTIDYTGGRTGLALVPYFSDLSGNKDTVWVEGDGVVRKRKSKKTLDFQGLSRNTFFVGELYETLHLGEENAALDWYGDYVREKNLGGSEAVPALKQYAQEIKETYGASEIFTFDEDYQFNYNRLQIAADVRSILSNKATYNLYLDDIPAGCDTIQYFLETGHEGYCMHFASAGVLLLQEFGVPARYASGYIVKASSFQKEDGQYTAKVFDRNAHAWAEIYLEGYGWVPYEMTPGYQDVMSSLPTDEEHQDYLKKQHQKKETKPENQEQQSTETQNSENNDSENQRDETKNSETQDSQTKKSESKNPAGIGTGTGENIGYSTRNLVIILALLIMVCTFTALLIHHFHKERETLLKEMRRRQYRRAVCRMNRRIYHRLWNHSPEVLHLPKWNQSSKKVQLSHLTDEEFLQKLISTYPTILPEDWKYYMEIVQKAAFSKEEITREEAKFCYRIYQQYKK